VVTIFRYGEVVRLCEAWHSFPICKRLHSCSPYGRLQHLVGSTNGMDPIGLKSGRVWTQVLGGNRRL